MGALALMALLGPVAGALGYFLLSDAPPSVVSGIMLFAAGGGILYIIFQDIAPQVRLKKTLGATIGGGACGLPAWGGDGRGGVIRIGGDVPA